MGAVLSWAALRGQLVAAFGVAPVAPLEERIVVVFERQPQLVLGEANRMIERYRQGSVHTPWPFLAQNIEQRAWPVRDVEVSDAEEKQRRVAAAKRWLQNAGMYFPTEAELLDELFGMHRSTAPLAYLEELEEQTRGEPGRLIYDPLLRASIAETRRVGRQPLPGPSAGRLAPWSDDDELRQEFVELWRERRAAAFQVEAEAEARGRRFVEAEKRIAEKRRRRREQEEPADVDDQPDRREDDEP